MIFKSEVIYTFSKLADDNESSRFLLVRHRIFNIITVNNLVTYYYS